MVLVHPGALAQVQNLQNFWRRQVQVAGSDVARKICFFFVLCAWHQPALTAVAAGAKSAKILTVLQGAALQPEALRGLH